ncbi:MAG: hypothetical protein HOG25_21615 [Gammaproteobacteria bacterium]|mgnify:FL=1|jgi:hypothetical protein|nr:hypothetical protein [Gammaproteobacteria bacterium]
MTDLFVDRFMRFNVGQGVVRLDFARVEDVDGEKNEIKMSPSSRVVMPVDGFMHFVEQANKLKEKIIEQSEMTTREQTDKPDSEEK